MRALPAIIVIALLIAGAIFVADRPGDVSLVWQGWRIDTSVAVLIFGVALIAVTAANALALWFVLGLEAHRDIIPLAEPWLVLIVMLVGLVSLRMLEQRQIASFQLLRARSTALAMQRQTAMFLALRDRLNSPLQTLVLGAGGASASLPDADAARMRAAR